MGHTYVVTAVKDSTYTEEGYVTYTCSYCEDSYTDIIPVLTNEAEIIVKSAKARAGETVDITVEISNNPGISSAKLKLNYNTDVLTLKKVTDAGRFGIAAHSQTFTSPYILCWSNAFATENFISNGTMVTLTFGISENAENGCYPITLDFSEDDIFNVNKENIQMREFDGEIEVTDNVFEGSMIVSGISFGVTLDGDTSVGTVYAALYDAAGKLKAVKQYPASDTVTVVFAPGETGAYAKIMWWNDNMQAMCQAQTVPLQ